MAEAKIIPPDVVIKTLEMGVAHKEAAIRQTLEEIDTLYDSYNQACAHLDKLREGKDKFTQAIRLLS